MAAGSLSIGVNLAGLTGVALLTAAVTGSGLSWTGPLAYVVLSMYAVDESWTTPWIWPARPPGDRGAVACAVLVLAAGILVITVRGARGTGGD